MPVRCIHEDKSNLSLCFNKNVPDYNCIGYEICKHFEALYPIKVCQCGEYISADKEYCNKCLIKKMEEENEKS